MLIILSLASILNWISYGTAAYNPSTFLIKNHSKCDIIHLVVAESVGNATVIGMKHFIVSSRPNGSGNDGMPSGHSMNSAIGVYSGFGLGISFTTAELRLKSHYHTVPQVIVGLSIGFLSDRIYRCGE